MRTTIHKIFAAERVLKRSGRPAYRYFVLNSALDLVLRFKKQRTYECKTTEAWAKVFKHSTGDSKWISSSAEETEALLKAASVFVASYHGRRRVLGDLLMLQPPRTESLPALHTLFRNVIGQVNNYKLVPPDELAEILAAPQGESRDVFIGGSSDPATGTLTLTRGNLETVVVPLSMFGRSGKAAPDPSDLAVIDYGHTIRLGDYEASADAILYEVDSEYRKRIKARRRREDKGFGASLRRLRIQRQRRRNDFPGLSAKTIGRLERGETQKPHGKTLTVLAKRLGVKPDEIETY